MSNSSYLPLMSIDEAPEMLAAMRKQEDKGYVKRNWIHLAQSQKSSKNGRRRGLHCEAVDSDCREKIAAWCFEIATFCNFNPETVEITLSVLDRFMSTPEGVSARSDRSIYQLASMAALYTTVKVHEPAAMPPQFVCRLSNGAFTPEDITVAETVLLQALKWRVNPPTSSSFIRLLVNLIPTDVLGEEERRIVCQLSQWLIDYAVRSYQFMTVPATTIAICAVNSSLESLGLENTAIVDISYNLSEALHIDGFSDDVMWFKFLLYEALLRKPANNTILRCDVRRTICGQKKNRWESIDDSPRTVTASTRI